MPLRLVAGSSVQLKATVTNLPGGVTWAATAGKVSPTGLYTAPRTPPKGGVVVVTATSTANPGVSGTAATGIRPNPNGAAAPGVAGTVTAGRRALSRILTGHVGRRVVLAKVQVGGRRGTLRFGAAPLNEARRRWLARRQRDCHRRVRVLPRAKVLAGAHVRHEHKAVGCEQRVERRALRERGRFWISSRDAPPNDLRGEARARERGKAQ